MDMTKVVADRLRNLAKDEQSLQRMREEITSLEQEFVSIRIAGTDAGFKKSGYSRSDWMDNNIQRREYLKHRIEAVEISVKSTRTAIESLTQEQRRVLDVFFLHRVAKPEQCIAMELGCDERSAWRKRTEALQAVTRALYGGIEL